MKYSSLREYFYKLHNLLYGIILLPFLVFVVLYWQLQQGNFEGPFRYMESYTNLMFGVCGFILVMEWIMAGFLFSKGLKAARTLDSLGKKLDRYFSFSILRFALVISGSLALAIGFYLTENQFFTILLGINIAPLLLFWPSPSKVCNDLRLKGDEQTLVLYKKDRL
jgi:hypothetical protein